ncbi:MAG: GTPase Era [Ruminococcus sp.]|nr:GTPase Era [Ruminococcus sp.]
MHKNTKNAFVTIIGRPNAGKSSLLNALVGEKIAAVSAKPQTTRTKITGVLTEDETQYVFMDTPGMHKSKNKLSEHMMKTVNESVSDVDIAMFVADCTKKPSENEKTLLDNLKSNRTKSILIINKIDLLDKKEDLIKIIADYSSLHNFDEVIPVSALTGDGLDIVMDSLRKFAVDGPHYFPDDMLTDQPEKVIMAEIIREKALNNLNEEIPHGIAVTIESLKERDNRAGEPILDISAVIYCERDSHKGIVIGKNGSMLRKIGAESRIELEEFFQIKINLQCWVKVKEGWRNREGMIRNFGLSSN